MMRLTALMGLLTALYACTGIPNDDWPTERWMTSTPEQQGMDSGPLVEMLREVARDEIPVHSVVIARHGRLVVDAYFEPYSRQHRHIVYSATKSITTMLIGVAIADGLISGDTQPVVELFPGRRDRLRNLDRKKRTLQLNHLLTMTAGFDWQDGPYGVRESGDFSRMLAATDGIEYILDKEVVADPGTRYNYNSGGSHLLAAVLQQATGQTALEYANARLFGPIGIRDATWSQYQGINNGGSELFLKPRDMARLGYLVLRRGCWEGTQVVPEHWVDRLTEALLETDFEQMAETYGYGWYGKHLGGRTVWSAEGLGGNGIYVIPDLDLVVVFTGGMVGREMLAPYRYLEEYILPAVRSPELLPANPENQRALEETARRTTVSEPPVSVVAPPPAVAVSRKLLKIEGGPNLLGIEALRFDFPKPAVGRIQLTYSGTGEDADWGVDVVYRTDDLVDDQQTVELEFGLDGMPRTTIVEHHEIGDIPVSAQGRWSTECRLDLTVVNGWAIPQSWVVNFCDGDAVTLAIESIFYSTTVSARVAGGTGIGAHKTDHNEDDPFLKATTGSIRAMRRSLR